MTHIESHLTTQDGLSLRTQAWKPDGEPKAVLVFTHGQGDWSDRYAHAAQALSAGGYAMYAYDLRGHGKSTGKRGHVNRYDEFLDDLQLVWDWAGSENPGRKVLLYAHSMGGQITVNFVLRRKPAAHGVMLTSPWLKLAFNPPAVQEAVGRVMNRLLPTFSQSNGIRSGPVDRRSHDLTLLHTLTDPKQEHGLISAREFFECQAAGLYVLEHASEFNLPVAVLCGGDDRIASTPASRDFYERAGSPDKTFKAYDGMFHEITNEVDRQVVFKDMLAWLDKRA
mgnify:CR=1 FL=1